MSVFFALPLSLCPIEPLYICMSFDSPAAIDVVGPKKIAEQ